MRINNLNKNTHEKVIFPNSPIFIFAFQSFLEGIEGFLPGKGNNNIQGSVFFHMFNKQFSFLVRLLPFSTLTFDSV